jgi:phage protein D
VQGAPLPGWVEWEVTNNTHRQTDTFRLVYAVNQGRYAGEPGLTPAQANQLMGYSTIGVEILAGFPNDPVNFSASELQSFILGNADGLDFDPVENRIQISGRDLAAAMVDKKTSEKFVNQKASDIAKTIASRHGLTADIDEVPGLDGTFYEIDHTRLNSASSEWDLLCELAEDYNCNVWVDGQTLHFKNADEPTSGVYTIQWMSPYKARGFPLSNVAHITFHRNCTLAKNVQVIVQSWNSKQKKAFTGSAEASKSGAVESQIYTYNEPGLSADQASSRAQKRLNAIVNNEMSMSASLPADNILNARMQVSVTGTGTPFDQIYYPASVTRHMSAEGGYTMSFEAKNTMSETETEE